MTRGERQLREAIIAKCRWMNDSGLNQARRLTSPSVMKNVC
jgi:hypothetical protein